MAHSLTFTLLLLRIVTSIVASPLASPGSNFPHPVKPRQAEGFQPDPNSGFDDPMIDIAYQGPFASGVEKSLVGPVDLLRSGTLQIGVTNNYTLPLYQAVNSARGNYWWVVTDSSDERNAPQLGVNFASKLRFSSQTMDSSSLSSAEQVMVVDDNVAGRSGMVDFRPVHKLEPGSPEPFPPAVNQPGSVGDANYTPLIQLMNAGGHVWNAPIIAGNVTDDYLNQFCDGVPPNMTDDFYSKVHDRVLAICPKASTVTLETVHGFSFSKSILYFAMDASDPVAATIDRTNYAPRLNNLETGDDDALFSGVERFFVCINGPTNSDLMPGAPNNETHHPQRQGLNSAILGEGDELNILGAIPTVALDYAPLWNFNLFRWTNYSIEAGIRTRLIGEFDVLGMAAAGYVTSPDGSPLETQKIVTNCPIVHRFL